jgi:hypothetical protein
MAETVRYLDLGYVRNNEQRLEPIMDVMTGGYTRCLDCRDFSRLGKIMVMGHEGHRRNGLRLKCNCDDHAALDSQLQGIKHAGFAGLEMN